MQVVDGEVIKNVMKCDHTVCVAQDNLPPITRNSNKSNIVCGIEGLEKEIEKKVLTPGQIIFGNIKSEKTSQAIVSKMLSHFSFSSAVNSTKSFTYISKLVFMLGCLMASTMSLQRI